MNSIAFEFGIVQVYWYSIFIFLAIITAWILIKRELKRREYSDEFQTDLFFNTIIFALLGARIYYVFFHLGYYRSNPLSIIQVWNGGLAIHGGLLFGFFAIYYTCRKYQVKLIKILDIVVIGLILGQAIGRWGNFFNGEAFGAVTTAEHLRSLFIPGFVIDGMYIMENYWHPTFFYEFIGNIVGFVLLLLLRKKFNKSEVNKTGKLFGFYLIWYSVLRFFIESLRIDSLMLGPLRIAQVVSLLMVIIGIYFVFIYREKDEVAKKKTNNGKKRKKKKKKKR